MSSATAKKAKTTVMDLALAKKCIDSVRVLVRTCPHSSSSAARPLPQSIATAASVADHHRCTLFLFFFLCPSFLFFYPTFCVRCGLCVWQLDLSRHLNRQACVDRFGSNLDTPTLPAAESELHRHHVKAARVRQRDFLSFAKW